MSDMTLMVPLPYMEQVSYGPLHVHMVPPHELSMSYMTLTVPPYLIWNRYHMVPHTYDMIFSDPQYLIWNRYLMVPLTLYGTSTVCSPHM